MFLLKSMRKLDNADMCSLFFSTTKYTHLKCNIPVCYKCSIFEDNEDYHGRVTGKSVAFKMVCILILILLFAQVFNILSRKKKGSCSQIATGIHGISHVYNCMLILIFFD